MAGKKRPSVFIGVPNLGVVRVDLSERLREWYHSRKYAITIAEATGYRPIELAVNNLLKQFLASNCEYLLLINSDENLPIDGLDRLLAHDKDVVAPLGLRWDNVHGPLPCVGVKAGGGGSPAGFEGITMGKPIYVQPTTGYKGLRRADRVGNSGMLLKRKVVEALPLGSFRLHMTDDRTRLISSEDFAWCDAIREAGFEIWVDCDMILSHVREVDLRTVTKLLLDARGRGREDTLRALRRLLDSGATEAEAVEAILEHDYGEEVRDVQH